MRAGTDDRNEMSVKATKGIEMTKRIVLAGIAALLLALGAAAPAAATMPGGNGLLVFASGRDGNSEIYASTVTGNTQVRLTENPAADTDPAFSPDGSRIAFVSDRDGGDREIYVMDADGSDQTRLTDHVGDDMDPTWSPDGTRLAIRRNVDGNNEIFAIDAADGGNAVNLTENPASDFLPDWSPDGDQIAFQRYGGSGTEVGLGNEVYLMNADGSGQVNLTDNSGAINDGRPSFSPDGTRIAFDSNREDSRFELYSMDLTGDDVTRLTDIEQGSSQEAAFSPDGTELAFRAAGDVPSETRIAVAPAAGGAATAVTADTTDASPAWQVDDAAPVTNITGGPAEGSTSSTDTATFSFGSSESEATFECRLDDGEWAACASPWETGSLTEGAHTAYVRSTDLAGNAESVPAHRTWTVDLTAPVVTIQSGPEPLTAETEATVSFTVDDEQAIAECRLDSTDDLDWEECESPFEVDALADGDHRLEVRAADPAGNAGEPVSHDWTVDTSAPVVAFDATPPALSNATSPSFSFSADDAGSTFECRIDPVEATEEEPATEWTDCDSPHELEGLAAGPHTFEVRATNPLGSTGDPVAHSWEIDTTAPTVEITAHPAALTNATTASFEYTVDDSAALVECRIDGVDEGAWAECEQPATYDDLVTGEYSFLIRATDEAGNVSEPVSFAWEVDATAPVVTIEDGPEAHTSQGEASIGFTSDDPDATYECRLDSSDPDAWSDCESPFEAEGLTDGDHRFEVRATDALGNVSEVADHAWNVDRAAPEVTIDVAPPALNASINALFEFSGNESDLAAECRLDPVDGDEEGWEACESPVGYSGLEDGDHRFEVRATDRAGNVSDPAVHEWEIATVKPVASILTGPATLTDQSSATFELDSDNPDATLECRLDPVEVTDESPATEWTDCASPVEYEDLADGEHSFEVRATETDQGTGPVATWSWTVDTIVPTVEITGAPAPISGTADPSFGFAPSEPGTTAECRLDPVDEAAPWTACISPMAYTGLAEGEHRFEVRVTDGVGHVSEPAAYDWIVETIPPGVTIASGPESPTTEISARFEFDSENPNAGFECRIDGGDWSVCETGIEYDQLEDGTHEFEVRAVGQGAGPGAIESRAWTVDTAVPTLTIVSGPDNVTNAVDATFELAMNKPGFTFRCQLDAEPAEACGSPAEYSGLTPGDHVFRVDALDGDDQVVDSGQWQWTVLADRPAAAITDGPAAASASSTAVIRFEADRPEATFECRVDGSGPWSPCTSPAGLSDLADGAHSFAVRAALPGGPAGSPVQHDWTVDTTAPDVSINGGPGAATTADQATFTITTDDPGATTECRLDGGAWAVCVGEVTFTGLADGNHVIRARAVDEVGNTSLDRRDWIVDRTAPVTTLTGKPDASTTATDARFAFEANEAGAAFECRLDGGDWKACSSARQVSGLGLGDHEFSVRATDRLGNVGEPASHAWKVLEPAPRGLKPKMAIKRRIKVDRDGTSHLATMTCPEGRCRVIAPKRVTFRLRGKRFAPRIKAPRSYARTRSSAILLVSSRQARRLIKRYGPAKIKVKLTVVSDNGKRRTATAVVRLVAPR